MDKKYKIDIADKTGHTTLEDLSLDEAVDGIITNAQENARWVTINGVEFSFEGGDMRSAQNVEKLRGKLEALEDPIVMLNGQLVGGSK